MNISLFDFPSGYNNNDYWDTIDKNRIRKRIYFTVLYLQRVVFFWFGMWLLWRSGYISPRNTKPVLWNTGSKPVRCDNFFRFFPHFFQFFLLYFSIKTIDFFFKKLTLKLLNNLPTQKINNHFTIIINRMSNLLTSLMIRLKSVWNYSFASVAAIYGNNYPFMVLRKVIAEISRKH